MLCTSSLSAVSAALDDGLFSVPLFSVHNNKSLGNKEILKLAQDQQGFIWLGTARGLFRFDGYEYKHINALNSDVDIRDIYVRALYVDGDRLLIGTMYSGLFQLDLVSGTVQHFKPQPALVNSIGGVQVNGIEPDGAGGYWVAHSFGLDRFDPKNGQFQHYFSADNPKERYFNYLIDIEKDADGGLWLSTAKGLARFDEAAGSFKLWGQQGLLKDVISRKIFRASDGRLWLATQKQGTFIIDPQSEVVSKLPPQAGRERILHSAVAETRDRQTGRSLIWLSGADGLEMRDGQSGQLLKLVTANLLDPYGLQGDNIYTLLTLGSGELYLGVNHVGLQYFNPQTSQFHYLDKYQPLLEPVFSTVLHDVMALSDHELVVFSANLPQRVNLQNGEVAPLLDLPQLKGRELVSGIRGQDGVFWFGSGNGTVLRVDERSGQVQVLPLPLEKNTGIFVRNLLADPQGNLWVGCDSGVFKLDTTRLTFSRLQNPDGSAFISFTWDLLLDKAQQLWIATTSGVALLAPETTRVHWYSKEQGTGGTLSNNSVVQLYRNRQGEIMLVTRSGIDVLVAEREDRLTFRAFAPQVTGQLDAEEHLLQLSNGRYWLGASVVLDEQGNLLHRFSEADGALDKSRSRRTLALSEQWLAHYYSGGLVLFAPDITPRPPTTLPWVISEAVAGNKVVSLNPHQPNLLVASTDQQFSLRFAALDYSRQAGPYRYQLKGYDTGWQQSPTDIRQATYTALAPGQYQLLLEAQTPDGQWQRWQQAVQVTVEPKLYQTWWFRLLCVLLLSLVLYSVFRWRLTVAQLRQREVYERRAAVEKAQLLSDLMEQKNQMLAEVTHDLRTPLAMVKLQLEAMQDGMLEPDEKSYEQLQRRLSSLNTMVGDIYQISLADTGALQLHCQPMDLAVFSQQLVESFASLLQQHQLSLRFSHENTGPVMVLADEDRLAQVLTNLLKNSCRYTNAGGQVCVRLQLRDNQAVLTVEDSAPAVSPEELKRLFERLYRTQSARGGNKAGSGLGLWICQSIVTAHQGRISATLSELGGLCMTVELPLADSSAGERE